MKTIVTAITIALATTNSDNAVDCSNLIELENEVAGYETEMTELKNEADRVHVRANRARTSAKYNKHNYKTFKYSQDSGFKQVTIEGFAEAHEREMEAIEILNEAERVRTKVNRFSDKVDHLRSLTDKYRRLCEGS